MKRYLFFTTLLSAIIFPSLTMSAQAASQNLILNPSAEDSVAGFPDSIPLWTEVSGFQWQRASVARGVSTPEDGNYLFFAGAVDSAELRQDVNISMFASSIDRGVQSFIFHGYVQSYPQSPPDSSRIILEYRSDTVSAPLRVFDTHNISNDTEWLPVTDSALAPAGTRLIRIRLISTRFCGSDNDGYYDALSLVAFPDLVGVELEDGRLPAGFEVLRNHPNPFNHNTWIEYDMSSENDVRVTVYDVLGHEITTLVRERQTAGLHKVYFEASSLPCGTYFCCLQAGNVIKTMKMYLVR